MKERSGEGKNVEGETKSLAPAMAEKHAGYDEGRSRRGRQKNPYWDRGEKVDAIFLGNLGRPHGAVDEAVSEPDCGGTEIYNTSKTTTKR